MELDGWNLDELIGKALFAFSSDVGYAERICKAARRPSRKIPKPDTRGRVIVLPPGLVFVRTPPPKLPRASTPRLRAAMSPEQLATVREKERERFARQRRKAGVAERGPYYTRRIPLDVVVLTVDQL